MKYLLLAGLLFTIVSCKKTLDNVESLKTIIHHGGLGEDTLHYYYDAKVQISRVEKGGVTYRYVYENNKIIQRHLRKNSILLESDSVKYGSDGDISSFIVHRFSNSSLPDERDEVDFFYQAGKLVSARSRFVDQAVSHDVVAAYSWVNDDIAKVTIRYSPTDSNEFFFTYSSAANPYAGSGQQTWLLDPGFDFTWYDNLQRLAYMSSKHCVNAALWYVRGSYFAPLTVTMRTNGNNNISMFAISPTDEVIEYSY
jgi:hypothetical protein